MPRYDVNVSPLADSLVYYDSFPPSTSPGEKYFEKWTYDRVLGTFARCGKVFGS